MRLQARPVVIHLALTFAAMFGAVASYSSDRTLDGQRQLSLSHQSSATWVDLIERLAVKTRPRPVGQKPIPPAVALPKPVIELPVIELPEALRLERVPKQQMKHRRPVGVHFRRDTKLPGGGTRIEYRWGAVEPER